MRVTDILKQRDKIISVEVQPPAIGHSKDSVVKMLDALLDLRLSWIDVTYHAADVVERVEQDGKLFPVYQRLHAGTAGLAGALAERYARWGIELVPHVICSGFTRYDTEDFLHELACLEVMNVLAIRGDGPRDEHGQRRPFKPVPAGHALAHELIEQIASLRDGRYLSARQGAPLDFGIGAACYPEGHPDAPSLDEELASMILKADKGAEYFVTQMFFDCVHYERLVDAAQKAGIKQPIIPGMKPLATYRHLEQLPKFFGCAIPSELSSQVEAHKSSPEAIRQIGVEWCLKQSLRLRELGAPSLHYFAARKSPIREVLTAVRSHD